MERQLFRWNVVVSSKFVEYNWSLCIIPEELAQQFGHLSTTFSRGNQILYNFAALVLEPSFLFHFRIQSLVTPWCHGDSSQSLPIYQINIRNVTIDRYIQQDGTDELKSQIISPTWISLRELLIFFIDN